MEPIRIGIRSNGTNTEVVDMATGRLVEGVVKVVWEHPSPDEVARATLTILNVPAEIESDAHAEEANPGWENPSLILIEAPRNRPE